MPLRSEGRQVSLEGMIRLTLVLSARLLVGAVFLMSSLTKVVAPGAFVLNVLNYRILPSRLARAYGYVLPYSELSVALLLLSGSLSHWAALVAILMLVSFMSAIGIAIRRGYHLDCSCFGLLYREPIGWSIIARDSVLVVAALVVFWADDGSLTLPTLIDHFGTPFATAALLLTGVTFVGSFAVAVASVASDPLRRF